MTQTTQSSNGPTNATTSPLDRAKQFASTLLSERGEASGALLARELHGVLRALALDMPNIDLDGLRDVAMPQRRPVVPPSPPEPRG